MINKLNYSTTGTVANNFRVITNKFKYNDDPIILIECFIKHYPNNKIVF